MYRAALADLRLRRPTLGKLAELKFFTKFESTVWAKPQVPRIISPRSPAFNILLGRYTQPVEHVIYDTLQHWFQSPLPVVAKGLTQQAKAAAIVGKMRPGWVCVGLDASRFDQSVSSEVLKAEHRVYENLYPGDRVLKSLLLQQHSNRGYGLCCDGMVRANIGPMRCSGDQNTSLGNILVMCLLIKKFCGEIGLLEYDVLDDGDDLLVFLPEVHLPLLELLPAWYLSWGFRMKVEAPARLPEQVEFCQSKPVFDGEEWVLVRNPKKAINTDYACGSKCTKWEDYLVHLRSVGVCGLSMAAGIPIFQEFYTWGINNGKTGKWDDPFSMGIRRQATIQTRAGYHARAKPVSSAARASFELAFGVPAHVQITVEQHISSLQLSRPSTNDDDSYILDTELDSLYI
jgi:hypothetical protein